MSDYILLQERVAVLDEKVASAHARLDKIEILIREDIKDVKSNMHRDVLAVRQEMEKISISIRQEMEKNSISVTNKLEVLISFMDRGKGWYAAVLFLAGIMGVIGSFASKFFQHIFKV